MNYFFVLIFILLSKAVAMLAIITFGPIGLGPDEAQYWTWSQQLDWGYYSKPPAIAWQIWLGTQLFGNNELGVRFLSVIFSLLISLAIYWLAIVCKLKQKSAFWAALIFAISPLGIISSLFAITDVGMALFWTLSCIVVADSLVKEKPPNYYLLGILIGCSALFKWPAYSFWLIVGITAIFYRFLINWKFLAGILISLLGLFPSVIWNIKHNWVTFRHVGATMAGGDAEKIHSGLINGNFFEFLGAQAALLSPIFFVLFVIAACLSIVKTQKENSTQRRKDAEAQSSNPAIFFCGLSSLIIILFYSVAAIFQKIQGNWCDFVYPAGIVTLCWYAFEKASWGKTWVIAGAILSIIIVLFGLSIPSLQQNRFFSNINIPYKWNPFRQNVGWTQLEKHLMTAGYDPKENFLFGDKYQMASILSFYGPYQKRAYFLNLLGVRQNQFSFWPSMAEEQAGKTGYFVISENSPNFEKKSEELISFYKQVLSKYFSSVKFIGTEPLFHCNTEISKVAFIFKCEEYNGFQPLESEKY